MSVHQIINCLLMLLIRLGRLFVRRSLKLLSRKEKCSHLPIQQINISAKINPTQIPATSKQMQKNFHIKGFDIFFYTDPSSVKHFRRNQINQLHLQLPKYTHIIKWILHKLVQTKRFLQK